MSDLRTCKFKFDHIIFQSNSFCAYQRILKLQIVTFNIISKIFKNDTYNDLEIDLLKNLHGQNIYHEDVECVK